MKTLKDKRYKSYDVTTTNESDVDYILDNEDVKKAILEYENFLYDLNNLGKTITITEFQNKHNKKRDLQFNYLKKFKEIFGNWDKCKDDYKTKWNY